MSTQSASEQHHSGGPAAASVVIGFTTHPGRKRKGNQDSYAVLLRSDLHNKLDALMLVADGMGGTGGGDVASRIVAQTVPDAIREMLHAHNDEEMTEAEIRRLMRETLVRANHRVVTAHRVEMPELKTMGTTCVSAVINDGVATVANIGDSRAYMLRGGKLSQLTNDHSEVWEEVKAGRMTNEQARTNRFRNVITRAIGLAPVLKPDIESIPMVPGDSLLLCSDGLNAEMPDGEIARIIATAPDAQKACDRLVDAALRNGGRDNITVVLLRYGPFTPLPSAEPEPAESWDEDDETDPLQEWRDRYDDDEDDDDEQAPAAAGRRATPAPSRSGRREVRRRHDSMRGILYGAIVLLLAACVAEGVEIRRLMTPAPAAQVTPGHTPKRTDIALSYSAAEPMGYKLLRPNCLVIDSDGNPIVCTVSGTLMRVTSKGETPLGTTFPTLATEPAQPAAPLLKPQTLSTPFATDPSGNLYALVRQPASVDVYSAAGTRTNTAIGKGHLIRPTAIAVNSTGDIFVLDSRHLFRFEAYAAPH